MNVQTAHHEIDVRTALLSFLKRTLKAPRLAFDRLPELVATGTEASIYRFSLAGTSEWSGESLILRLTLDPDYPLDVEVEHAVQNTVHAQGFPAPRVYASGKWQDELRRPFVIMADGCKGLPDGQEDSPMCSLEDHMAALAWLHRLNGTPLKQAFREHGVPREKWSASIRYSQAMEIIDRWHLEPLRPLMAWVRSHRPAHPGNSICHGDPHAGNLLIRRGRMVAMLDWPSARLGHAEADLGLLCGYQRCSETTPAHPETADLQMLEAYRRHRPCSEALVRYYEAEFLASLMASVGDQQQRQRAGLQPPANPILDDPGTLRRLRRRLRQLVSVDVPIPETLTA